MEAIIRTNDKNIFERVLNFLQLLPITVETKNKTSKIKETKNKLKIPMYKCEGKVSDFNRENLYDARL